MNPTPIKLTDDVIEAINQELEYQFKMAGTDRANKTDYGVPGQLLTLSSYATRAQEAWVNRNNDTDALDVLRKCAGIAVRALILYGCPKRK